MTRPALISDRERERAIRQADKVQLRRLHERVKGLRLSISRHKIETRKQRRQLLANMRRALRALPRRDRSVVRDRVLAVARQRTDYQQWWAGVLLERARRRAELAELRAAVRTYRAGSPARVAAAVAKLRDLQREQLDGFEQRRAGLINSAEAALEHALRELATERRDQRQMARTKRTTSERKARRATKRERRQEFTGGVEANLTTALEHAVWKREKGRILSNARARGITAPDAIAEMVRERAEAEQDLAIEYLADDADAWLEAELRKQGYS